MTTKADTIFYGGDVLTMDEDVSNPGISRTVEAVAVADGMILEVGSREDVFRHASHETQMICLDGQVLMPGFIEPHQHACLNAQLKSLYTDIEPMRRSMISLRHAWKNSNPANGDVSTAGTRSLFRIYPS